MVLLISRLANGTTPFPIMTPRFSWIRSSPSALYGREIAKRKNGDAQNSKTDTAAALTMDANVRANFTRRRVE